MKMRLFPLPSSKSVTCGHLVSLRMELNYCLQEAQGQDCEIPCRKLLFKVQTREALLKVRSEADACRPLEARTRAHGGSVNRLKVGKKPKGEGLVMIISAAGSTVRQLKMQLLASGPGADTSVM